MNGIDVREPRGKTYAMPVTVVYIIDRKWESERFEVLFVCVVTNLITFGDHLIFSNLFVSRSSVFTTKKKRFAAMVRYNALPFTFKM